MVKTVGVCGYGSTGSSAVVDLLHEFDETQVLDIELVFVRKKHGLVDLEYLLKNHGSFKAITRFIYLFTKYKFFGLAGREKINKAALDRALNGFIDEIVSNIQGQSYIDYIKSNRVKILRYIERILNKHFPISIFRNVELNNYRNFTIMPDKFEEAARTFIDEVLTGFGMDLNNKEKSIVTLNQSFNTRDPVKCFKFFKNPMAIIVDRDPRDQYLFSKYYLNPRGVRLIPSDNVDTYIKWFCKKRQFPSGIREREDIIFINFESLVYDTENATKKVADFLKINKHIRKGECFKPSHSRNNTQLFKKYTECESDIRRIESELSDFIFPFEDYPDIEPEGGMFYGSQNNKITKPVKEYIHDIKKIK